MRLPRRVRFGLWLNLERQQARAAAPIASGIELATGGNLGSDFFSHLTDREDQARLIAFRRGARHG